MNTDRASMTWRLALLMAAALAWASPVGAAGAATGLWPDTAPVPPLALSAPRQADDLLLAQANDARQEDQFWADSRSVDNTEAYKAYLESYPRGRYAGLARAFIARLASPAQARPAPSATTSMGSGAAARPSTAPPVADKTPGKLFRDCTECPEMVVIPSGSFIMGSSEEERNAVALRVDSFAAFQVEQPQHGVIVPGFALGKHAVTRGEFAAFIRASGYQTDADKALGCSVWGNGSYKRTAERNWLNSGLAQSDDHPAVCVSWNDAVAYAQWLSQSTGRNYRLPSEAEREYATRAQKQTPFWWGDRINTDQANFNGNFQYFGSARGEFRGKTMPVDSFKPNPFGLTGVHGNVYEWVEDCWHDNYGGAPNNGSAWLAGCVGDNRVRRGGSWVSNPAYLRAAFRSRGPADLRESGTGFRLALSL
jgi:formylglycine-generating enzyme required for sulfatase activity